MPPMRPVTLVTRDMKWYGGPGSRATRRVPSKRAYIGPNADDGTPHAHASSDA